MVMQNVRHNYCCVDNGRFKPVGNNHFGGDDHQKGNVGH